MRASDYQVYGRRYQARVPNNPYLPGMWMTGG
jgi:hypothetical protein